MTHPRLHEETTAIERDLLAGQIRILEMIANGAPLARSLNAIVHLVESLDPGMLCSILLLDEGGTRIRHGAAPSLPAAYIAAIDGAPVGPCGGSCGTAAWRREQVIVADIESDPLWKDYRHLALAQGLRACWSTPIFSSGRELLGTFAMYYRQPKRPLEHELKLIEAATHVAGIVIDRTRVAEALRESEARYRDLFDSAHDLILIVDPDMSLRFVNAAFRAAMEYSPEEIRHLRILDIVHPEKIDVCLQNFRRVVAGEPVERVDAAFITKSGRRIEVEGSCNCSFRDREPTAIRGIFRDVTHRREAERALRSLTGSLLQAEDEERRRIAQEMHDATAQDLVAAMLTLDRLTDTPPGPQADALLADSRALIEKSISDLRTLSYILHPPRLEQTGLAGGLREYAVGLTGRTDLRVRVESPPNLGRMPHHVELALFRVAQESLGNVLRHAHSDAATVRLDRQGEHVTLEIEDFGCGLTPGALSFGSGVGIAGMRERLERLGGRLDIGSTPRGTTVRATLLLADPEDATPENTDR